MIAGEPNPFINSEEWVKSLDQCRTNLENQLANEAAEK